jgi:hypothetical protein
MGKQRILTMSEIANLMAPYWDKRYEKAEIPIKCPLCEAKLILNERGWGFCDMCVTEILAEEK